jgi:hypothetical protein
MTRICGNLPADAFYLCLMPYAVYVCRKPCTCALGVTPHLDLPRVPLELLYLLYCSRYARFVRMPEV